MWEDVFSNDYVAAAQRFRDASDKLERAGHGPRFKRLRLEQKGPVEEELAIDTCIIGDVDCDKLLLSTSGIHGVEGYAGSAIQLHIMRELLERGPKKGVSIAFVHALNPWGMAWLRRVDENNVDLNRNFLGPDEEYQGEPDDYAKVDHLINPAKLPSRKERGLARKTLFHVMRHGWARTKQAIAEGQYTRPSALQYGGSAIEHGPFLLLEWLEDTLDGVNSILAIDLHTGLGRFGRDTLLVNAGLSSARLAAMRARYGKRICPLDAASGIGYEIRGDLHEGLKSRWPAIDWTCITQEFGTYRPFKVLKALRAENAWTQSEEEENMRSHWSRQNLLKVFNPRNDEWRGMLLKRGRILFEQGLEQLQEEN